MDKVIDEKQPVLLELLKNSMVKVVYDDGRQEHKKARGIHMAPALIKNTDKGIKTQISRALVPQPSENVFVSFSVLRDFYLKNCRYGQIGDLLYIRETYCKYIDRHIIESPYAYKLDSSYISEEQRLEYVKAGFPYKWKSSRCMPQEAARKWLLIKSIKIESIQEKSYVYIITYEKFFDGRAL